MAASSTSNGQSRGVFQRAVAGVLTDWPALRIAVENSFGGVESREKAEWLVEVMTEFIATDDGGKSAS